MGNHSYSSGSSCLSCPEHQRQQQQYLRLVNISIKQSEREQKLREALLECGQQLRRYGDPKGDKAITTANSKEL